MAESRYNQAYKLSKLLEHNEISVELFEDWVEQMAIHDKTDLFRSHANDCMRNALANSLMS
jgi:hypothetical protein